MDFYAIAHLLLGALIFTAALVATYFLIGKAAEFVFGVIQQQISIDFLRSRVSQLEIEVAELRRKLPPSP